MAGPASASKLAVRVLGPTFHTGAVPHPHGPTASGAAATLRLWRGAGGLRWQLAGGAGAAALRYWGAVGRPQRCLARGAALSTWCWRAAPLLLSSGPSVGRLGPTLHPGAESCVVRPRWPGAAAALKHWGVVGWPQCRLATGAGAAVLRYWGAAGRPQCCLANGAALSTWCWRAAPLPACSGPVVGRLGPTLHPGAASCAVGPRWPGAAAALKHLGVKGRPQCCLATIAGAAALQHWGAVGRPQRCLADGAALSTLC